MKINRGAGKRGRGGDCKGGERKNERSDSGFGQRRNPRKSWKKAPVSISNCDDQRTGVLLEGCKFKCRTTVCL